jgi:hypothetical protein
LPSVFGLDVRLLLEMLLLQMALRLVVVLDGSDIVEVYRRPVFLFTLFLQLLLSADCRRRFFFYGLPLELTGGQVARSLCTSKSFGQTI